MDQILLSALLEEANKERRDMMVHGQQKHTLILSGFSWNSITRRFEAEEEVWKDLIREKPHAAKWKTMQIKHYDVLRELLGIDRAVHNKFATNT
ncbi:hypothetical protein QL285_034882 [Trifolium repens]|nr:hypothetical protein QL285_034882 [Trifolium repens]